MDIRFQVYDNNEDQLSNEVESIYSELKKCAKLKKLSIVFESHGSNPWSHRDRIEVVNQWIGFGANLPSLVKEMKIRTNMDVMCHLIGVTSLLILRLFVGRVDEDDLKTIVVTNTHLSYLLVQCEQWRISEAFIRALMQKAIDNKNQNLEVLLYGEQMQFPIKHFGIMPSNLNLYTSCTNRKPICE